MSAIKIKTGALKIKRKHTTFWPLAAWHSCGYRLFTDNSRVWCSGINCYFDISKQQFEKIYIYNSNNGQWNLIS